MTPGTSPGLSVSWPEPLCAAVRSLPEHRRLWVAFSGGLDSCLLLHSLVHCYKGPVPPAAIHVNHQLQVNAEATEAFCRDLCRQLGVELCVRRVTVPRRAGPDAVSGLEHAARHVRYRVFEELLQPGDLLLMTHHADDQAETVLFRLLRGTGVRGLAGMPRQRPLGAGRLFRPLLDFSREQLLQWATAAGLQWVEDPSNSDQRFDRNFLRHGILPALKERWPGLNRRLAHTAAACADSAWLNDRLAEIQWQACRAGHYRLQLEALSRLSSVEQTNLIRWWIRRAGFSVPARSDWAQAVSELIMAAADRSPQLDGEGFSVRRFRDCLYLVPAPLPLPPEPAYLLPGIPLAWGEWRICLEADAAEQESPAPAIRVSTRQGGERFRPAASRPSRTVKKWLQEQGVPPWDRARIPLIFRQDGDTRTLIAIGNLWCHEDYSGGAPGNGWRLRVERDFD